MTTPLDHADKGHTDKDLADDERNGLTVVSVHTDEVAAPIGPRQLSGLVAVTDQKESEARAARVYQDTVKQD